MKASKENDTKQETILTLHDRKINKQQFPSEVQQHQKRRWITTTSYILIRNPSVEIFFETTI